jgi:hypothetical protein
MWTLQKVLKPEAQQREKASSLTPSPGQTVEDTVCELLELLLRCVPWCLVVNHHGYPEFWGEDCISYSAYPQLQLQLISVHQYTLQCIFMSQP